MRRLRQLALLAGLAAWLWPQMTSAAGVADGPGCLGVTAEECVRWLRTTMTLDEGFLATALAQRHQVDVNGKPLGGGLITVYARLPGHIEPLVILLHLRADDRVQSVESNLLRDLIPAHTEELYDQSAVYEIVTRLLGRRCPPTSKIELYRFFENSVKPRIHRERQDLANGLFGLHRVLSHVAGVPLCGGVTVGYTNFVEWRGSSDVRAGRSEKSLSSIQLQ
ncbi:MAG TPA: hypothetical protein VHY35_08735 [Stellaceae bacterium]|jgi:hypothetical protein|nr:hypothetical protein [Stellaceae bacterium]